MTFMNWIIDLIWDTSEWFYEAYKEVRDWVYPFSLLEYPLYAITWNFRDLAEAFYDFSEWVEDTIDWLSSILSWSNIRQLILGWIPNLESIALWFLSWVDNIKQVISDWWAAQLPYILDYIDAAVGGLEDFIATWDNFWTVIYPSLVSFNWLTTWWNTKLLDIDALINSWFVSFTPFWEGWQEIRNEVTNFFADPLQWFYDKLDEFFERFW